MMRDEELMARAREVRENAYAPYSSFRVGAAILCADGQVFVGANVENAAYPTGICAERAALAAAVSAGARDFKTIAIVSDSAGPTPPCGQCRQALAEFGTSVDVLLARGTSGESRRFKLSELFPLPFNAHSMDKT